MSNKKLYALAGILMITTIVFLVILKNSYINKNTGVTEQQRVMIETSGWPIQDVPVMNKENLEVSKFSEYIQIQEVKSGVSFTEFVDYLFELSEAGFGANSFYGCKHPSMINSSIDPETIDEFTWLGTSDKYDITATWMKEGTSDRVDNVMVSIYWKERTKNITN